MAGHAAAISRNAIIAAGTVGDRLLTRDRLHPDPAPRRRKPGRGCFSAPRVAVDSRTVAILRDRSPTADPSLTGSGVVGVELAETDVSLPRGLDNPGFQGC